MLNFNQTSVILHDFNKANIDENNPVVPDYLDLKESFFQNNVQDRVIPISIIEMELNYVKPSSIENQEVFVESLILVNCHRTYCGDLIRGSNAKSSQSTMRTWAKFGWWVLST